MLKLTTSCRASVASACLAGGVLDVPRAGSRAPTRGARARHGRGAGGKDLVRRAAHEEHRVGLPMRLLSSEILKVKWIGRPLFLPDVPSPLIFPSSRQYHHRKRSETRPSEEYRR